MSISTFTSALKVLVEDWKKQQEHAQAGFDFPRADAIQECINSLAVLMWDQKENLAPTQLGYTLSDVNEAYTRGKAAAMNNDTALLDWLDIQNAKFNLGWNIQVTPAGALKVNAGLGDKNKTIRQAIMDAHAKVKEKSNVG